MPRTAARERSPVGASFRAHWENAIVIIDDHSASRSVAPNGISNDLDDDDDDDVDVDNFIINGQRIVLMTPATLANTHTHTE